MVSNYTVNYCIVKHGNINVVLTLLFLLFYYNLNLIIKFNFYCRFNFKFILTLNFKVFIII